MRCQFCDFTENDLVIKDYKYWTLVLAESQQILGWTYAFLKRHIENFEDLSDEELIESKKIVKEVRSALSRLFQPDWFNVMQLGNMTKHLHFQLVPRYKEKREFLGRKFVDVNYGHMVASKWIVDNKDFLIKLREKIQKNI